MLQNNLSDYALADGSVLAKFSSQFGDDAILWGTVKSTATDHIVELKLKDLTGKELFTDSYGEPSELTSGEFPATTSSGGWPYYFLGLDGVSAPKCYYMSNPPYPEEVRKDRISGVIVLSGLVTTQGTVDETRIVKSLGSKLDALSLQTVSTWRCKPAKSPNGTPIPLRVPFQITFKLY